MKEHALFLRAGFTLADPSFSQKAEFYLKEFDSLLCEAVSLSDGIVGKEFLGSGEVITEFTSLAEKQTDCFTGIPINKEITRKTQTGLVIPHSDEIMKFSSIDQYLVFFKNTLVLFLAVSR